MRNGGGGAGEIEVKTEIEAKSGFAAENQPVAYPLANIRRLRRHRRALKGRCLSVQ
ncbi:MAG: hypothetical protein ACFWUL_06830 [Dialister sp.]|jgi:hypothetical protein